MSRRALIILTLTAIALQAMMGGIYGDAVAICLGGGHEHGASEVAANCDLACEHDASFPAPVPVDDHDGDCDCTDIELTLIDLLTTGRHVFAGVQLWAPKSSVTLITPEPSALAFRPAPRWLLTHDPGGRSRLAIVRATRLTL